MSRRRGIAGLALIVAIAAVIAVVLATRDTSGATAGTAAHHASAGDSTVQRRNLVQTDTESGTLAYAAPHTVYNRLTGTITWLPAVGRLIQPGQPLFRIENRPVILMDGSTPAYRTLSPSDTSGPDILQLNRNLVKLGFNPAGIVEDDEWQAATTAGVEQFQASVGETETGTLVLGQVVFLPGPQRVSTVDGTVGSTGGGGGGSAAALLGPASHSEFVSLIKPQPSPSGSSPGVLSPSGPGAPYSPPGPGTSPPSRSGTPSQHPSNPGGLSSNQAAAIEQQLQAVVSALRAETEALRASRSPGTPSGSGPTPSGSPSSPSHSSPSHSSPAHSSPAHSSSTPAGSTHPSAASSTPAVAILSTTSNRLIVTVQLPASSQSEARVGAHVTVELPDRTSVGGRITGVSALAQSSSSGSGGSGAGGGGGGGGAGGNGGSSATVPVTITLNRHLSARGLDQASVSVLFAQARANHVLSVPVTALIATSGSSYAVQEASLPHRLLPVTTGLFAAGYVEISGAGIQAGLAVTDSQG